MINIGQKWKNMISIKIGHKDSDQRNIIKALQKLKQATDVTQSSIKKVKSNYERIITI